MLIGIATKKFLDAYFSVNDRGEKTRSAYGSDMAQFQTFAGEDFDISGLNNTHIEGWASQMKARGYSPASVKRKIVVLKIFCAYWVRHGILSESPFWRVKISFGRIVELPRTLTTDETRRLIAQANKASVALNSSAIGKGAQSSSSKRPVSSGYLGLRNVALLELLFATGMRVGEVSAVNVQDFVCSDGVIKVKGKGGKERLAFIVDEVTISVLGDYLATRLRAKVETPALFLNVLGSRLSTQGIANVLLKFQEDSGIERRVTPHMLRHTVATLLLRNGVDIRVVQEFLGHSSIATTQRYTHVAKEHLVRELKARHPSLAFR